MQFEEGPDFARRMDAEDPVRHRRDQFLIPMAPKGEEMAYFCGHSLGLQPKRAERYVEEAREDWARFGVDAHFRSKHPYSRYATLAKAGFARLVGAQDHEVTAMNGLTVNLHLMMVSFYRPTRERYRVVMENTPFPSDRFAVESQVRFHADARGFDASKAVVELKPRDGERLHRPADLIEFLEREGKSVALVLLGQVNYLTGQAFDLKAIAQAARKAGCAVGFDLAHGAGNLMDLNLHDSGADFAVWCTYKYLNGGPGCVAGAFVHERHHSTPLPRFEGWWGNHVDSRFRMAGPFEPAPGADAWQISNTPILTMAPLRASLEIFDGIERETLAAKARSLTGYLEFLIDRLPGAAVQIVTPRDPKQRGCQLSLKVEGVGKELVEKMREEGVLVDFREPDVLRLAPVPLYNTHEDVWRAAQALRTVLLSSMR
ncbi:MAG TPA: kynureninase [Bdellovibrionota bacterium]|jgi:kynureninase|nr:kynureninase [Bdellovibrionota bacterium]